ncbi:type IV fimbrial biogenesis protein FimT [Ectothiorhodospira marina]|uniref:Type II secretion system protein H n=2 Tax=Ectothiorhodospira marina TaxID=1396821 RepID=A0A1H7RAE7_9GAMM|nr:type IV fimbrial biogenesis protein FimT [Ectothiorhodospira marina]
MQLPHTPILRWAKLILMNNRGFTLVELMVTLSVAAILMTVAIPGFLSLRVSNALSTQSNELVAAINLARSEAIRRNARVRVCRVASETSTDCAGSSANWTHWAVVTPDGVARLGEVDTLGGRITVSSDLNADTLTLGPDGLARSGSSLATGHHISIAADGGNSQPVRCLRLGAGSRISVERQSGACS